MEVSGSNSIMFADGVKNDSPGRHVDTHGKRLRGKQQLYCVIGTVFKYLSCWLYSGTSEQGTLWGGGGGNNFVPCREIVPISEVK